MKENLKLSIIPFITLSLCCFFALIIQNSYHIDPDYVYLLNGLNAYHGHFEDIIHVDHPGTPLQLLMGILLPIIAFFRNTPDVAIDLLLHPNAYIKTIIVLIAFSQTMVLFFIGKAYYKHRKNLLQTLILQSAILISTTVILFYMKIFTETLIPLGVLLLILILIKKIDHKINDLTYSILAGIIIGLFIATKITFAPLFFLAIIMLDKYRNIAVFLSIMAISFVIGVLPVIERISYFQKFIFNVATHDGSYGTGNVEMFNPASFFRNMIELLSTEWAFTIIFIFAFITLIINIFKHKKKFFKDKERKLLLAITTSLLVQLIMVSKNGGMRYMAPSLLLLSFAMVLIIQHFPLRKQYSVAFILVISMFVLQSHTNAIKSHLKVMKHQKSMQAFIQNNIQKEDAVLIVTDESWIGSPFQEHSIMFGKMYCAREGFKYNKMLNELYPNRYFWAHNKKQYASWDANQMPELLLEKHGDNFFIYLQYANTDLHDRVTQDFFNSNKNDSNKIFIKKIFNDPFLKEKIYQIKSQNRTKILPQQDFFCDFEENATDDYSKLITNIDSIFIRDGEYKTDYTAFGGKHSLSISAERKYGLPIALENIKLHNFIKVELKCKRNSPNSEFLMIAKNAHPEDGFFAFISSASKFENDEWETLTFTFRIVNQPKEGLLDIYFWNNSKKDIFVDDFRIKIY